ncbi:MAG: diamine N-acetyltransferase [Gaiellaceae bacterium]|nr:diamine N-acetyltransferase [Gaiellaceae bacterium]
MIRPARADDVPALADLARRTWLDAFGESVSPENAAAEADAGRSEEHFRAALEERTILVAEESGSLVGYVEFDDGELRRLYVETALQGRGIGGALLDAALAHPRLAAAERVVLQVWEENTRAVRLYESVGFRRTGTKRFTIGDEVVEDAVFELDRARGRAAPA